MAKLQRGVTFSSGTYTATDLNNLVDSATILPGAITEQSGATPAGADSFLIYDDSATGLRKCTLTDIIGALPASSAAGTASLRTLGTGSTDAAAGNDSRFSASVTGIRKGAGGGGTDVAATAKDFAFGLNISNGHTAGADSAIDWDAADVFYDDYSALGASNKTLTFSNVRSYRAIVVCLKTSGYTGTIAWPTLLGTAPLQTNGSTVHVYTFINTPLGTVGTVKAL